VNPTRLAALLATLVVAAACASAPQSPEPIVLDGTSWRAVSVDGRTPIPGVEPTVSFAGGSLSGTDGCNQYRGTLRFAGSGFVTDELGGTLMLCEDRVMAVAEPFLAILRQVDRVAIADGRLMIAGPAGEAVFVPTAAR
jgi:heat shock protein HslJ